MDIILQEKKIQFLARARCTTAHGGKGGVPEHTTVYHPVTWRIRGVKACQQTAGGGKEKNASQLQQLTQV